MFLQNHITLKDLDCFFDSHGSFGAHSRPVEYFFQDIQRTMDKDHLENLQLFLISARKSIYQDDDNSDGSILRDYAINRYMQRFQKVLFFFDCCCTLDCAERQQKAFERQSIINHREGPSFLPEEVRYSFFEELYNIKICHGFHMPKMPKISWIQGYQELYFKCRQQPIPAMLLPLMLTIFSTDGKTFSNLYAYFKYKNRRFSKTEKEQVVSLFEALSKAVKAQFPNFTSFTIPIFHWAEIEDRFCTFQNLSEIERETAKEYFGEYRNKNDLSKAREKELLKLTHGQELRSLAKLCNLNTYITMNCLPCRTIPAKAKRPFQRLTDGRLLPTGPKTCGWSDYDKYFYGLYKTLPANPAFSQLALLRYYQLSLDSYLNAEPDFFSDIEEAFAVAISQYRKLLQCNYWLEQQVLDFDSDNEWLRQRMRARLQYELRNIPERHKYARHAKIFAHRIISTFSEQDYRDFIGDVRNFHISYFPEYLRQFCSKYAISEYEHASNQEACFMEDEAFSTILVTIQNYLLENVNSFWHKAVAKALYT